MQPHTLSGLLVSAALMFVAPLASAKTLDDSGRDLPDLYAGLGAGFVRPNNGNVFSALVGWQLNDNWGTELSVNGNSSKLGASEGDLDLTGVAFSPEYRRLRAFAKLGVADSRTHVLSDNNYVLGKQVTATGGAGLELRLSDAFYIRAEWQDFPRFSHVASNVSFSTMSLIAHF